MACSLHTIFDGDLDLDLAHLDVTPPAHKCSSGLYLGSPPMSMVLTIDILHDVYGFDLIKIFYIFFLFTFFSYMYIFFPTTSACRSFFIYIRLYIYIYIFFLCLQYSSLHIQATFFCPSCQPCLPCLTQSPILSSKRIPHNTVLQYLTVGQTQQVQNCYCTYTQQVHRCM